MTIGLGVALASCAPAGDPQAGPADLAPARLLPVSASTADGSSLSVTLTVDNLETGTVSSSFSVAFYLSHSQPFATASDTLLATVPWTAGVEGGGSVSVATSLPLPEGTAVNGVAWIYAVVDPGSSVAETDESNNQSAEADAAVVLLYDDEASPPWLYPVRLETYAPSGSESTDTVMALYRENGAHTAVSFVASDLSGGNDWAFLDYTGAGLESGTYHVMVYSYGGRNGPYAFTVRTVNVTPPSFTPLASNAGDPGEADDTPAITDIPGNTTIPAAPVQAPVGTALNRYSAESDWDWFTFTLP